MSLLQETLLAMTREDAEYHMDRCIKSGLWVPDAKKDGQSKPDDENTTDGEAVYEKAPDVD